MIQVEWLECTAAKKSVSDPQPPSVCGHRRWVDKAQIEFVSETTISERDATKDMLNLIVDFWKTHKYNEAFYAIGLKSGEHLPNVCLTEEQVQQLTA